MLLKEVSEHQDFSHRDSNSRFPALHKIRVFGINFKKRLITTCSLFIILIIIIINISFLNGFDESFFRKFLGIKEMKEKIRRERSMVFLRAVFIILTLS